MTEINEGSTADLTITVKDASGNAITPDSFTYRVDDKFSGHSIKASTSVTPSTSMEILLDVAENTIYDRSKTKEIRVVTVTAKYAGSTKTKTAVFEYTLVNLDFI